MILQLKAVCVASIFTLAALLLSSCSRSVVESDNESANDSAPSSAQDGDVQWIDPNEIQPGPIQREELTDAQMARIKAIQRTFVEVDGQSVDQWVDNFKRDLNPDRELAVWERMAKAYEGYCSGRDELTLDAKKEVYKVVLLRSMAPRDEVFKRLELQIISKGDAIEIMNGFAQ